MSVQIVIDKTDWILTLKKFQRIMPEELRVGLIEAMDYIGLKAVEKMPLRPAVKGNKGYKGTEKERIPGDQLNIVSGRLSKSILDKNSAFGKEGIRRIVPRGKDLAAFMGSQTPYAAAHEYGYAKRNLPARPYLGPAIAESEPHVFALLKLKLDRAVARSG